MLPFSRPPMPSRWMSIDDAVARALSAGAPVVALESTLVTHGLPQPEGLDVAADLETRIRQDGATPATIGIVRGVIRVGLAAAELRELAGGGVEKVNLSNLASVLAGGHSGSTTVAATMFAAHACGIRIFATGGIGGVHRDVTATGDVSADLTALARIPVAVVSAGAKAILDLSRTVEALETLGVPTLGWRTGEFPAFYRRSSGLRVDRRFEDVESLAEAALAHFELELGTGVLVVNPVPEADEMDRELYERALQTALSEAGRLHIDGRRVTPFLLDRLRELTAGESVRANIALLRDNASLAARLAIAMRARRAGRAAAP